MARGALQALLLLAAAAAAGAAADARPAARWLVRKAPRPPAPEPLEPAADAEALDFERGTWGSASTSVAPHANGTDKSASGKKVKPEVSYFYATHIHVITVLVAAVFAGLFWADLDTRLAVRPPAAAASAPDARPLALGFGCSELGVANGQSLQGLLEESDAPFVLAVDGRQALTYALLRGFLAGGGADLARFGLGRGDRLAALLGNGPEAAVALFAVAAQCGFAPVDPTVGDHELRFILEDLPARALIALPEHASRNTGGVPVIVLHPDAAVAGLFRLSGAEALEPPPPAPPAGGDAVAVLLHTSGTTRKPKLVPRTHQSLVVGARCIRQTLELTRHDRCLNMLPLFHIGGLTCNIMGTAAASASVVCAPSFGPDDALRWLAQFRPTWYYASPAMHMVMARGGIPRPSGLRFVRSASSVLLPSVALEVEQATGCEILDTYASTECMPLASNRLGMRRKAASVGPRAGPDIRIDGETSEILVRGTCVTSCYEVRDHFEEDPNVAAFVNGWFRTGDCGVLDENGYLTVTGRSKEIINRGGEKMSPFEIEDELRRVLAVRELAAFGAPHEELGEVVAVAVVTDAPDEELGAMLVALTTASDLSYKWRPQVLVKVDALLKGPTGKPKRGDMARHLGLPTRSAAQGTRSFYVHRGGALHDVTARQRQLPPGAGEAAGEALEVHDSLGFITKVSPQEEQDRQVVLAAYGIFAVTVVIVHFVTRMKLELNYAAEPSEVQLTPGALMVLRLMMLVPRSLTTTNWKLVGFVASNAFMQAKGLQWQRTVIKLVLYVAMFWPLVPLAKWIYMTVRGESQSECTFAGTQRRRYMLLDLAMGHILLGLAKKLPRAGQQAFIAAFVALAAFWLKYPVPDGITKGLPRWLADIDTETNTHDWCVHAWWLAVFLAVGCFGTDALKQCRARAPVPNTVFWSFAPTLAKAYLFVLVWVNFLSEYDTSRSLFAFFADAAAGLCMFGFTLVAVSDVAKYLAPLGTCAVGIYVGHGFWWVTEPHTGAAPQPDDAEAHPVFGIMVAGHTLLPNVDVALAAVRGRGLLQVLVVLFYITVLVVVCCLPFQWCFNRIVAMVQATGRPPRPAAARGA